MDSPWTGRASVLCLSQVFAKPPATPVVDSLSRINSQATSKPVQQLPPSAPEVRQFISHPLLLPARNVVPTSSGSKSRFRSSHRYFPSTSSHDLRHVDGTSFTSRNRTGDGTCITRLSICPHLCYRCPPLLSSWRHHPHEREPARLRERLHHFPFGGSVGSRLERGKEQVKQRWLEGGTDDGRKMARRDRLR